MTDTKHTPTPWQIEGECGWISTMHPSPIFALKGVVGSREQHIADAAHIVKCVNMHEELVRQNQIMKEALGVVADHDTGSTAGLAFTAKEALKKAGGEKND